MPTAARTFHGLPRKGRPSGADEPRTTGPLVFLCLCLIAVAFGRLHELNAHTMWLPVGKVLFPLTALAVLARRDVRERLRVLRTTQGIGLLLLCGAILLSIPFGVWPGGTFFEAKSFLAGSLPYVLILAVALRHRRDFDWAFAGIVFCTMVFALGMATGMGIVREGRSHVSSTYDPNDIALAAVITIPMAAHFVGSRKMWLRIYGLLGAVCAIAVVGLSASRGGVVALAAVALGTLWPRAKSFSARWKMLLVPTGIIVLAFAPPTFWRRLQTLQDVKSDYNVNAEGGRIDIWKRGLGLFASHPLTGVGFQQFSSANGMSLANKGVQSGALWQTAHNTFVQASAELGVVGLTGLLMMLLPVFAQHRRRRLCMGEEDGVSALGGVLAVSVGGFVAGAFFLSAAYTGPVLTLTALGMAYSSLARRRPTPSTVAKSARILPAAAGRAPGLRYWKGPPPAPASVPFGHPELLLPRPRKGH